MFPFDDVIMDRGLLAFLLISWRYFCVMCLFYFCKSWGIESYVLSDKYISVRLQTSLLNECVLFVCSHKVPVMRKVSWDHRAHSFPREMLLVAREWFHDYRKTCNIRRTLLGKKIVDHSDVVGASPVGAAPTTSSFSTQYLASMDWTKKTTRRDNKLLKFGVWCVLY